MKFKQKVDLSIAIFLIMIGCSLLILPIFKVVNLEVVFITVMILYAIANFLQFILTRSSKDYEGLFTSLISVAVVIASFFLDITEKPVNLAMLLMAWITIMSVIKLKKSDYYDDRNNKMWKLRIATLALFMIVGFLTSINLYYEEYVRIIVLGYFFFIHGVLELTDPIVNYLLDKKSR